jgi:hypothetical protein
MLLLGRTSRNRWTSAYIEERERQSEREREREEWVSGWLADWMNGQPDRQYIAREREGIVEDDIWSDSG